MLLYSYPALVTPICRTFIIKGNANNGRNPPSCPFPTLMTPFPDILFINEQATGFINEEAIGVINETAIGTIIAPTNTPFCFFI